MDKAFLFGEKQNLVGILSEPDNQQQNQDNPLILILNSGLVHRPGPLRMNKEFSIYLAEQGFSSFRFDLSGIGDSEKLASNKQSFKDRNLSDVGEAIEFIKDKVSPAKIIVMGLCTGADLAHRAAVQYDDISGSILLDGYGYPTKNFYIKRYLPILTSPKRIFNLIGRVIKKLLPQNNKETSSESGADAYYWELPEKQDYIAQMQSLHKKGCKHLYVYTSGVREYYNYKEQFVDTFKDYEFCTDVDVNYFSYADHIYVLLEQRKQLFESTLDWIKRF